MGRNKEEGTMSHHDKRDQKREPPEHSILFITNPRDQIFRGSVSRNRYLRERCESRFYDNSDNALARLKRKDEPPFQFVVFAADELASDFLGAFAALKPRPQLIVYGPDGETDDKAAPVFVRDMYMLEGAIKRGSPAQKSEQGAA